MVTAEAVRMARAGLRMRTRDLAAAAGVSPNTVTRIEAGFGGNAATLAAVRQALERAGATFPVSEPGTAAVAVPLGASPRPEEGLRPEDLNASNDG